MIEKIIELIAPHQCVSCSGNNNIFCTNCLSDNFPGIADICALCSGITSNYRICLNCNKFGLYRVYICALYEHEVAQLIKKYKFEHARAAHEPLAMALDGVLSYIKNDVQVIPIPTSPEHIRQRGFDHTHLIAKRFAKIRGLRLSTPLFRVNDTHQIGSDKSQREIQAKNSLSIKNDFNLTDGKFLLIDDVCTTGATLNNAAKLLKSAGALQVEAAVVAWQPPNKKA